jgi:hypothetical protein
MLNTEDASRFEEIIKELKTYGLNEYMAVPPKRKLNLHGKSTEDIINETRAFAFVKRAKTSTLKIVKVK